MDITVSTVVNAPIERVFDVFSDVSQTEQRISGITKVEILSDMKRGEGLRWRETRVMFGKEATEEMEISAYNPSQSYEVVAQSRGVKYHARYTFAAQGDSTKVDLIFTGTPVSMAAKLMVPLGVLFKGATRKALQSDMDDLKRVCEAP